MSSGNTNPSNPYIFEVPRIFATAPDDATTMSGGNFEGHPAAANDSTPPIDVGVTFPTLPEEEDKREGVVNYRRRNNNNNNNNNNSAPVAPTTESHPTQAVPAITPPAQDTDKDLSRQHQSNIVIPNGTSVYYCLVMSNPFFRPNGDQEMRQAIKADGRRMDEEGEANASPHAAVPMRRQQQQHQQNAPFGGPSDDADLLAGGGGGEEGEEVTDEDIRKFRPSARVAHTDDGLLAIDRTEATVAELEAAVVETIWRLRLRGLVVEPKNILMKVKVSRGDLRKQRQSAIGRCQGRSHRQNPQNGEDDGGNSGDDGSPHSQRRSRQRRGSSPNANQRNWNPRYPLYVRDGDDAKCGDGSPRSFVTHSSVFPPHSDMSPHPSSVFHRDGVGGGSHFASPSPASVNNRANVSASHRHSYRNGTREFDHHYFRLNKDALLTSKSGRSYGKRLYIKVTAPRDVLLNYVESNELMLRTHPLSDAGGAIWAYTREADEEFARSVRNNKGLLRKERRRLAEDSPDGDLMHMVRKQEDWYKRGTLTRDPIGDRSGGEGFIMRTPEKLRMIEMIIRDPFAFGGCGLQVKEMANEGSCFVEAFFPLHDEEELKRHGLIAWASFWNLPKFAFGNAAPQWLRTLVKKIVSDSHVATLPIDEDVGTPVLWHRRYDETFNDAIMSYFGDEVALYFLWLHELISFLPYITVAGIICAILPYFTDTIPQSLTYLAFGILSVVWGAGWVIRWSRKEYEYLVQYQQELQAAGDTVRDEYDSGSSGMPLKLIEIYKLNIDIPFIYRRSGHSEDQKLERDRARLLKIENAEEGALTGQPSTASFKPTERGLGTTNNKNANDDEENPALLDTYGSPLDAPPEEPHDPVDLFVHFRDLRRKERLVRQLIGGFVIIVLTAAFVALTTFLTWWRFDNVDSDVVSYASSILGVVGGTVISVIFDLVVDITNDGENYPTDRQLESATVRKSFFYSFFYFYYSMFIIALYPSDASNQERLDQLETQMIIICVAKPAAQNLTEIFTPALKRIWNNTEFGCCQSIGRNTKEFKKEEKERKVREKKERQRVLNEAASTHGSSRQENRNNHLSVSSPPPNEQQNSSGGSRPASIAIGTTIEVNAEGPLIDSTEDMDARPHDNNGPLSDNSSPNQNRSLSSDVLSGSTSTSGTTKTRGGLIGMLFFGDDYDVNEEAEFSAINGQRITPEIRERIRAAKNLKRQSNFAPYVNITADYMEIVLQFGFMVMFASTFPWAPLCALFYNIIEIKIDASRHVFIMQRPIPQATQGIGQWKLIKAGLVALAMVTNSFFICVLSNAPEKAAITNDDDSNGWDWKSFIILQYVMVVLVAILFFFYGKKPHEARRLESKMAFLARRLRFKTSMKVSLMHQQHDAMLAAAHANDANHQPHLYNSEESALNSGATPFGLTSDKDNFAGKNK